MTVTKIPDKGSSSVQAHQLGYQLRFDKPDSPAISERTKRPYAAKAGRSDDVKISSKPCEKANQVFPASKKLPFQYFLVFILFQRYLPKAKQNTRTTASAIKQAALSPWEQTFTPAVRRCAWVSDCFIQEHQNINIYSITCMSSMSPTKGILQMAFSVFSSGSFEKGRLCCGSLRVSSNMGHLSSKNLEQFSYSKHHKKLK